MSNNEKTVTELREIAARLNEKRYVICHLLVVKYSKVKSCEQIEKKEK